MVLASDFMNPIQDIWVFFIDLVIMSLQLVNGVARVAQLIIEFLQNPIPMADCLNYLCILGLLLQLQIIFAQEIIFKLA